MENLVEKINSFIPKSILVIGDLMLDKHTFGKVTRLNPEVKTAPLIQVERETYNPGGAGNTAVNVKAMGSIPILFGVVGEDLNGNQFVEELKKREINPRHIYLHGGVKTIVKNRIIGENVQIARIDYNEPSNPSDSNLNFSSLVVGLPNIMSNSDIVIISDYAKGTLAHYDITHLIEMAHYFKKPVAVDTKPCHYTSCKRADFIKPNYGEACEMAGMKGLEFSMDNAKKVARKIAGKLESNVLLTLGENGLLLCQGSQFYHYCSPLNEPKDVSGAGDSVLSAFCISYANGLSVSDSAKIANYAGMAKIKKIGVQPVTWDDIVEEIKENSLNNS